MKFTDKQARKIFNSIKCSEVKESIRSYPEDERGGKTDIEIIRDEVEYFLSMYEEEGTRLGDDLEEAREILRETHNGKFIPIVGNARLKYTKWDITRAKSTVSEYRQLKSLIKRL